jgi:hypothetical protein
VVTYEVNATEHLIMAHHMEEQRRPDLAQALRGPSGYDVSRAYCFSYR